MGKFMTEETLKRKLAALLSNLQILMLRGSMQDVNG